MNDLTGFTRSFQEWSGLLDFLSGFSTDEEIKQVHIAKEHNGEWRMKVRTKRRTAMRKPTPRGVGLYDLFW